MIIENSLDKTSIRPISGYHRDNMKTFYNYLSVSLLHWNYENVS